MQLFSNNFKTTLASAIDNVTTSIAVVSSAGLPTLGVGDTALVTLESTNRLVVEIVEVTAVAGNVLTVVRGREGTVASSFELGSFVEGRLTAGWLNSTATKLGTIETGAQVNTVTPTNVVGLTNKTLDDISNNVGANRVHYKVKNMTGSTLANGTVVKVAGYEAGEETIRVTPTTSTNDVAIGIVHGSIAQGEVGLVVNTGVATGINTTGYTTGVILYQNGAGGLTHTKPTTGTYQAVAVPLNAKTDGALLVEFTEPNPVDWDGRYYTETEVNTLLDGKQDTLVSGTNIKTINGNSVLGSGDLIVGGSSTLVIENKTAAYTVVAADNGKIINCTSGTFTISLTAAATLGAGFSVTIWNTSTTTNHVVTVDPAGSEQIGSSVGNGYTTYQLKFGQGIKLVCDGTYWHIESVKPTGNYNSTLSLGQAAQAISNYAVAVGSFTEASGVASLAVGNGIAAGARALSNYSTSIGANSGGSCSVSISSSGAMALGGSYASGTDSFAAAIANNTSSYGATGANSIAIGQWTRAQTSNSIAIGYSCTAGTNQRSTAIGYNASATGLLAIALGGGPTYGVSAASSYSIGISEGAITRAVGHFCRTNGKMLGVAGDSQYGQFILNISTTGSTPSVMVSDTLTANAGNQVILPNNSAYTFSGTIVARQSAAQGTATAAWKVEGLIRREGTAATTTLVASTVTAISNVPGWGLALSADTTNGGLAITATGAAATNIRWVATVDTSEVIYG